MQKHSNHCWLKLRNFVIHLYHTAWVIMITCSTAVVNYVSYTNYCYRNWSLSLGSFDSLLFTVLICYSLYQSSFFAAVNIKNILIAFWLYSYHLLWCCCYHGNRTGGTRPISSFSNAINRCEKSFITGLFWWSYFHPVMDLVLSEPQCTFV